MPTSKDAPSADGSTTVFAGVKTNGWSATTSRKSSSTYDEVVRQGEQDLEGIVPERIVADAIREKLARYVGKQITRDVIAQIKTAATEVLNDICDDYSLPFTVSSLDMSVERDPYEPDRVFIRVSSTEKKQKE